VDGRASVEEFEELEGDGLEEFAEESEKLESESEDVGKGTLL
jgi:hypothetical protein